MSRSRLRAYHYSKAQVVSFIFRHYNRILFFLWWLEFCECNLILCKFFKITLRVDYSDCQKRGVHIIALYFSYIEQGMDIFFLDYGKGPIFRQRTNKILHNAK